MSAELLGNPAPKDQSTYSSSHELPMESRATVGLGSGMHSVCLHSLSERPKLRCHKVLSEGSESRSNHRFVVGGTGFGNTVVTIQPMQNKNFSGNPEEPDEVPGADEEAKSHLH